MPLMLRTQMLRGDLSSVGLIDYATSTAQTWCGRLGDVEAWKAAARPGGGERGAEHVCRSAEEPDVCARILRTREGAALVRSVAVFVLAACHM